MSFKTTDRGDFPLLNNAALWVDNTGKRLYSWGGEDPHRDDEVEDNDLWVFEPDGEGGGTWSTQSPKNPDVFDDITRGAQAGYATCDNTGVSLGGIFSEFSDPDSDNSVNEPLHALLSFDMETKKWSKDSAEAFNYPYETYFGGRAVCGTAGDSDPFLFPIGGYARHGDEELESVKLGNLTFYDTKSEKWHWQSTHGDGPPELDHFCAVGVRGPDETYEM